MLPPCCRRPGSALVEGFEIRRQPPRVREVIGYVPQALSADGELTAYENLLVFAQLYDIRRAKRKRRIGEALASLRLADAAHHLVRTYSDGMIRRLEIAQSMLHRPKLLFLDEPTVGLDPIARDTVWSLRSSGMDIRQLRHDPWELFTGAIQPMLWLLVFGQVFERAHSGPAVFFRHSNVNGCGPRRTSGSQAVWRMEHGMNASATKDLADPR